MSVPEKNKQNKPDEEKKPDAMQGMGQGMKVSIDLLSSLIVGAVIGYALDRWLGTKPFLMVFFIFFGGVTGLYNVYRQSISLSPGPKANEKQKNKKGEGEDNDGGI